MKLTELLHGIEVRAAVGDLSQSISGLSYDSRSVEPGFLFFAIKGFQTDGNRFVDSALGQGAAAVVSELPPRPEARAWVQVADDRKAMAQIAANFYRHPSEEMTVAGVTGTNGKTTTAFLLDSIFKSSGSDSALMGTIRQQIGGQVFSTEHTTPEAPDTERFLRQARDSGCEFAAIEVSSHALQLRRCDFVRFGAVIFTNLTRDHLDFHGSFDHYYAAKRRLFVDSAFGNPVRVINREDPYGTRLWEETPDPRVSFGFADQSDFQARDVRCGPEGISFRLAGRMSGRIESQLAGEFNVYNLLGACAAAGSLGFSAEELREGVARLRAVPGRMERVPGHHRFHVFVDFAHTDDALRNTLQTVRSFASGRVIVVFGCGGDRDRTKRPIMGVVAAELADLVVLTSDNPRSEDPEAILREIEPLVTLSGTEYVKIPDRSEAVRYAIRSARAGDVVLLAGKGHEEYQIIGNRRIPYSDRETAMEALEEL